MNSKKFETALFDFDGTLFDSSEGIFKSLIYAFEADGREIPPAEELRRFIGPPIYDSFKTLYGYSDDKIDWMVEKYRERYRVKGIWETRVYDGVPELLKALKAAGMTVATASSKPVDFIIQVLEKFGLLQYFDDVSGVSFDEINSDKTAIVRGVLDRLGKPSSSAVMIGDRKFDIDGAHGAGVTCVAVLYGFGSREEFLEHKADFIAATPSDVEKIILGG